MTTFEVEFDYTIREGSSVTLEADDTEQAEDFAHEYIRETYDDVTNVEIVSIKEIKNN